MRWNAQCSLTLLGLDNVGLTSNIVRLCGATASSSERFDVVCGLWCVWCGVVEVLKFFQNIPIISKGMFFQNIQ